DRAPLMVLADAYDGSNDHVSHQRFDQTAMLKPLTKAHDHLGGEDAGMRLDKLTDTSLASPQGAVYLELRGADIRAQTSEATERTSLAARPTAPYLPAKVQELLSKAERPLIIAGLQSCETAAAAMLRKLVAQWDVPVLVTYKAKGVVPDNDDHLIGYY